MMVSEVREMRSMPLWLLREYLVELGGVATSDTEVVGDGWQATISQMEDVQVGVLTIKRVRLVVEGEAEAMDELRPRLEKKCLRAGG